jgi:hypothetical protein
MKKILSCTIFYLAFSLVAWSQWTSDVMNNTLLNDNPGRKFSAVVTPGLNGQVYIAWLEANPTITVKMQLINADGTLCWNTQGLTISSSLENVNPKPLKIISDDGGNAYIVWYNSINGTNGLYASKMSSSGDYLWGFDGVTIYETELYDFANTSICQSHNGNLLIASEMMSMSGVENSKIMLQKLGYDGAISWETPVMIEDPVSFCTRPMLVPSGTDEFMVSFVKTIQSGFLSKGNLWVQKIGENGNTLFGEGKEIFNINIGGMTLWQSYDVLSCGNDDMLIAWHCYGYDSPKPVSYLQHISSEGVISWPQGVMLTTDMIGYSELPRIAGKNQNGETVVFWMHTDVVNDIPEAPEIYTQKISSTGELLWTDFGKKIIPNPDNVTSFNIDDAFISDNLSFFIYDQTDAENVSMMWNKIFAVGIDNNGDPMWPDTSTALSLSNMYKSYIVSTSFVNNQSVVGWVETDTLGNSTIKGQNFNNSGIVSIEEKSPQSNDVRFLPNPVNDVLTFLSNSSLISISVYDITGKRLLTIRDKSIDKINLSPLNPGIYIVEYIMISGENGTKKIIKN